MRFIVREQHFEKPIAAGKLRYEQDGTPTGAVETWRLTTPTEGVEILRVDLDARSAPSGHSYLYHLIRQDNGRLDRLNYRFWGDGLTVAGTILWEGGNLTLNRTVNSKSCNEEVRFADKTAFWFPSSIGLGLLGSFTNEKQVTAVTLNTSTDNEAAAFCLQQTAVNLSLNDAEAVQVGSKSIQGRPFTITWADQQRTIWLDEQHNWPLKMKRSDGLTAIETQYIRYQ